jgi:hypothetical protein
MGLLFRVAPHDASLARRQSPRRDEETALTDRAMTNTAIPTPKTLLQTIEDMANAAPTEGFSLKTIMEELDETAFGAGLFLLALPCCLPFLYGVPQVVSLPMMALAGQMAMGRSKPWLPDALAKRVISKDGLIKMAKGGRKWLGWIEIIVKPRLVFLTGKPAERIIGAILCVFCASILVPLPLTNTIPGFAVAIAAFGLLSKDGLLMLGGLVLGSLWVGGLIGAAIFFPAWILAKFTGS